jgi:hypothetical protein
MKFRNMAYDVDELEHVLKELPEEIKKKTDKVDFFKLRKEYYNHMMSYELEKKKISSLEVQVTGLAEKVMDSFYENTGEGDSIAVTEQTALEHLNTSGSSEQKRKPINLNSIRSRTLVNEEMKQKIASLEMRMSAVADETNDFISKYKERFELIDEGVKRFESTARQLRREMDESRGVEQDLTERISILSMGFGQTQYKIEAFDEVLVQVRKISERARVEVEEINLMVKEMNLRKFNEAIKSINIELNLMGKDLDERIEKKVDLETFNKAMKMTAAEIKMTREELYHKSDRLEVKKALLFLERKIKEIITIITEKEGKEKDTLLTKKLLHCLSCDREVEKFSGTTDVLTYRYQGWNRCDKLDKNNTMRLSLPKFKADNP